MWRGAFSRPFAEVYEMPRYVKLGQVPRKRHIQFRQPDGSLYSEQVFGTKGFSGINSILYHIHPPTRVQSLESLGEVKSDVLADQPLRHFHLKTVGFRPHGDPITGRTKLLLNDDVSIG